MKNWFLIEILEINETSPRVIGSCDQATSLNLICQMSTLNFRHQLQILDSTSYASNVLNLWLTSWENYLHAQNNSLPQTYRHCIIVSTCLESNINNTIKLLERSKSGSASEARLYWLMDRVSHWAADRS